MKSFTLALVLAASSLTACAQAQTPTPQPTPLPSPLFSQAERAQIIGYWNAPGRYEIGAREAAATDGVYVVRLTPAASVWFRAYARAIKGDGKIPPTLAKVQPKDAQSTKWDGWVNAKLAYDRWQAGQTAAVLNAGIKGQPISTQPTEATPLFPGLIPPDLEAKVGNPPPLAAAVAPRKYTVRFDDGYIATYTDNISLGSNRNMYYRFAEGVAHYGTGLRKWPEQEVRDVFTQAGMTPFEQNVARAVSRLEGGFESINTYDTGYVSVGFIQFASLGDGGGSLGELMLNYKRDKPNDFQTDFRRFGIDVDAKGLLVVLDPTTGAELHGPDANAKIIEDKRLIAVFQRAGKQSAAFRAAQIQQAKRRFYPANYPLNITVNGQTLTGKISDVIKSEAGMATLFDRSVNTGNVRVFSDVLTRLMTEKNLTSFAQASDYERDLIKAVKWREDFLKDPTLGQPK